MLNKMIFTFMAMLLAMTAVYTGCSKSRDPLSPAQIEENWRNANPAPSHTPTPGFTIWKNGQAGTFGGQAVSVLTAHPDGVTTTVIDNISGDTTGFKVGGDSAFDEAVFYLQVPSTVDVSEYYANGHVRFNLKLGITTSTLRIRYGNSSATLSDYDIAGTLNSTSNFVAYSIPFSDFSSNMTSAVNYPFAISITDHTTSTDPAFVINDIRWTID